MHHKDITPTSQILHEISQNPIMRLVESLGGEILTGGYPGVVKEPS